jgi:hypothetical protein
MARPIPEVRLETIGDAFEQGFRIILPYIRFQQRSQPLFIRFKGKNIENTTVKFGILYEYTHYSSFLSNLHEILNQKLTHTLSAGSLAIRVLEHLSFHINIGYSFIDELAAYNKTIFIGDRIELNRISLSNMKTRDKAYYGKQHFLSRSRIWTMSPMEFDRFSIIQTRLSSILYSGILLHLETARKADMLKGASTAVKVLPLSSRNNFISTFVTYAGLMIVSCLVCYIEGLIKMSYSLSRT